MKKNFRRLAAVAMATVMVFGSAMTTFADTDVSGNAVAEGEASGSAVNTGTVDKNVFHVTLPTAASNQFDFIADPGDYIKNTGYKALSGTSVSVDTTNTNKVYFPVVSGGATEWKGDSAPLTVTNKSSIAVDITLSVSADIEGMDLVTGAAALTSTDDPQLYLGIVTALSPAGAGTTTATTAITSGGATVNGTVSGQSANYEVVCSGEGAGANATYSYEKKSTLAQPWVEYSFYLTGKCNDVTCDDTGLGEVDLTWSITNPSATATAVAFTNAGVITISGLGSKTVSAVQLTFGLESYDLLSNANMAWNTDKTTGTMNSSWISYLSGKGAVTVTVTLSDGTQKTAQATF